MLSLPVAVVLVNTSCDSFVTMVIGDYTAAFGVFRIRWRYNANDLLYNRHAMLALFQATCMLISSLAWV